MGFVEQTVRDETPAHLMVYFIWKQLKTDADQKEADDFDNAYQEWQEQLAIYRNDSAGDLAYSIPLRAARDRLIDWLGLGQTYPLRDLQVTASNIVEFKEYSRIEICNSQHGVKYELCDNKRILLTPSEPVEGNKEKLADIGNGGKLTLVSPAVVENTVFSIKATKQADAENTVFSIASTERLFTWLLQTHAVTVGLNNKLVAFIQNGQPLGDNQTPAPDDDRIVDYDVKVKVAIEKPQEGVDYQLVRIDGEIETILPDIVTGNAESISLNTLVLETKETVTDDMDIRIRATKIFAESENRKPETDLLITVLPLKVRANPKLSVSVLNPIVDYSGTTGIKIQAAQKDIKYQGLIRNIADYEYVHGAAEGTVFTTPVSDKNAVTLRLPTIPDGFEFATETATGDGGDLTLNLTYKATENINLTDDSFVAVQAIKTHKAKTGEVSSTVYLKQVAAVLVRPNPNPDLHLTPSSIKSSVLRAPIQVTGGEPGVFYEFAESKANKVLGLPVYFPHLDSVNNTRNVGIGQVQVEVDLVVAADGSAAPQLSDNVTLSKDAVLSIRAYKAQSGVEVTFTRKVSDLLINPK
jgi:hypothetical protein